jgi:hypothetical protein
MKWLPHQFRVWLASIACRIFDVRYAGKFFEFSDRAHVRGAPRVHCVLIGDSIIKAFSEWYADQPRMHLNRNRYYEAPPDSDEEGATLFVGGGEYFEPISSPDFVAWCAGDASPAVARWSLIPVVEWLANAPLDRT